MKAKDTVIMGRLPYRTICDIFPIDTKEKVGLFFDRIEEIKREIAEAQAEISFKAGIREVVAVAKAYIPKHHNLCYGIIDPHPDCDNCKWQAKLKEWEAK